MKVLFPLWGFVNWNGGVDFVRLIVAALSHAEVRNNVDLHFILPEPSGSQRVLQAILRRWRSLRAGSTQAAMNAGDAASLRRIAEGIISDYSTTASSCTRENILAIANAVQADVVFPTMCPLGRSSSLPQIGYLFDFQHRYMPHLFAARTRRNRDKRFRETADASDGIVVNSRVVARDVVQFLEFPENRVLAMPFTPYAQPWWFDSDPAETAQRYGIAHPYILVCNHFWTHKDHATALRAFALLRDDPSHAKLQLVLTGDPVDHRDPRHYARLVALGEALGISRSTHYLGLVPKRDQLALLRGCAALIQPTLFEGGPGGGSVYEAVGLGVPAVVSDIPINREVDCGNVRFFEAGNPEQLALKTREAIAAHVEPPNRELLLTQSDARLGRLAKAIVDYLDGFVRGRIT